MHQREKEFEIASRSPIESMKRISGKEDQNVDGVTVGKDVIKRDENESADAEEVSGRPLINLKYIWRRRLYLTKYIFPDLSLYPTSSN